MIITKKAMPRRTFLRGMGATMALPLLEAMVPAATPLARTPAHPVRRPAAVLPTSTSRAEERSRHPHRVYATCGRGVWAPLFAAGPRGPPRGRQLVSVA